MKKSEQFKFYNLAFDFLMTSYASWRSFDRVPTPEGITVAAHIDEFRIKLINNKIYIGWIDRFRFNRYLKLAIDHAKAWDAEDKDFDGAIKRYQDKIKHELKWLADKTGRTRELSSLY